MFSLFPSLKKYFSEAFNDVFSFLCMCVHVCADAHGGQKVFYPLKLFVSHHVDVEN